MSIVYFRSSGSHRVNIYTNVYKPAYRVGSTSLRATTENAHRSTAKECGANIEGGLTRCEPEDREYNI